MGDNEDLKKREMLKSVYPNSDRWKTKVDNMSPAQVTAVYFRLKSEGKLG